MSSQPSLVSPRRLTGGVRRGLVVAALGVALAVVTVPVFSGPTAAQEHPCPTPNSDVDNDRLSCADEMLFGTDPGHADTDGDGYSDWYELFALGTNPLDFGDPGGVIVTPVVPPVVTPAPPGTGDRTGPALVITAPRAAKVKQAVTIQASAADPSGIARVTLFRCQPGCKQVAQDVAAPYRFVRTHPKPGRVTYKVRAYDTAGNVTEAVKTIKIKPAQKPKQK